MAKRSLKLGDPDALWKVRGELANVEARLDNPENAVAHYEKAMDTIESMREGLSDRESKATFMRSKIYVYDEFIDLLYTLHKKHPQKGYDRKAFEIFERKQGRVFLEEMGKGGARHFSDIPVQIIDKEEKLAARLEKYKKELAIERSKTKMEINVIHLRHLEEQIDFVLQEQQALQNRIKTQHPDYYAIRYPSPCSSKEIQESVLNPDEMILVYSVMKNKTFLWAIGKSTFYFHMINKGVDEIAESIGRYRDLGINIFKGKLRGQTLSRSSRSIKMKGPKNRVERKIPDMFAPLFPQALVNAMHRTGTTEKVLRIGVGCSQREIIQKSVQQPVTSLYIVPTGPLYLLPFETINIAGPGHPHYLIEDYSVSYLSSASLLNILRTARERKTKTAAYPLLAFANPVYGKPLDKEKETPGESQKSVKDMRTDSYRAFMGGEFAPLPETEGEARAIKNILNAPDSSSPLQLRNDAAHSNVMSLNKSGNLNDYRYLVFACHGILPGDINRINQPSLVLSDPDPLTKKDGFLTMSDVFSLKLNADLITLSACNTGRGASIKGEGVMGLTRAFMYAGTPSITVTLWSVESESAKAMNIGLFENLKAGKNRAQALRQIKIRMIKGEIEREWRHPFYWGPMVMFGDGG